MVKQHDKPSGHWSIATEDLPSSYSTHLKCRQQALPPNLGNGYSNTYQLDSNLSYIETRYAPTKDFEILNTFDLAEPRMVVTLGLQGHSSYANEQGDEVYFDQAYTTITSFNSSTGARRYAAEQTVLQLRLVVDKLWLDRYFGEHKCQHLFNKGALLQVSHQPTSYQALVAAKHLLNAAVDETVRPIFMHSEAMSILAAELSVLCPNQSKSRGRFVAKDHEIAVLARNILMQEYKQPPSVNLLAKRVRTNQFKLKQLFHHFFNNTPYGVLLEIRMHKAYQLLERQRCSVAATADAVGYQHASNFSAAFSKYFGIAPKVLNKK